MVPIIPREKKSRLRTARTPKYKELAVMEEPEEEIGGNGRAWKNRRRSSQRSEDFKGEQVISKLIVAERNKVGL